MKLPRPLVVDTAIAVAATVASVLATLSHPNDDSPWKKVPALSVDVSPTGQFGEHMVAVHNPAHTQPWIPILLLTLPLAMRRRYPLAAFGVQFAAAFGVGDHNNLIGFFAIVFGAFSAAVHSPNRLPTAVMMIGGAAVISIRFGNVTPPVPGWATAFVILVPLWWAGSAIRTRQLRVEASEDRARRLERDQEAATRRALAAERARIARELHDVVSHNVSVMVVQAGAARQVIDDYPGQAAEAMRAVEVSGREAMTDLRHLLGLLAPTDDDAAPPDGPLGPQPGLDQIDALVAKVGSAGLPVELRVDGTPRPLSPALDLTAYRVVQEALTNALRYAGGARTEVLLRYGEGEVELTVRDEGAVPATAVGAGRGLLGMRERVGLYGGTVDAGPRLGGGYQVRATIPVYAP
jgi:signal transduction histidine kinase